jgi:acyl-CoA synthetase (AMP-forming)/AMP-acid ligase II
MLALSGVVPEGYYKDEAKSAATFRVIDGTRYVIPGDFAAVVGVPDERWGEAVCALVEGRPGVGIDDAAVIDYVKARLANFKAPKHVLTVASIGRSPSGKLDYARVRADAVARMSQFEE